MLVALCLDWLVGWPDTVFRRIGHPVTWVGRVISVLDQRLNRPPTESRILGIFVALGVICIGVCVALALVTLLPGGVVGAVLAGVLAWPLVAARSMHEHVEAVRRPLADGDLEAARLEVSRIVGRDPEMLDDAGIARAAIESLAENTSDGVIAPLFWGVLFGLPGIAAYKCINTLDSMIGHKSERYMAFGWASARIDDVANVIPARLTGTFFALVTFRGAALRVMARDARLHRSPNAGWPEAAMAGALGVRLSGPRGYGGVWNEEPWVNEGATDPTAGDIGKALAIFRRSLIAVGVLMAALVFI